MNLGRLVVKTVSAALLVAGTLLALAVLFHPLGAGAGSLPGRAASAPAVAIHRPPLDPDGLERITVLMDDAGHSRFFRDGVEVTDCAERDRLAKVAARHLEGLVGLATPVVCSPPATERSALPPQL